jgi:molecular chaperone DnaK (HSP70)
MKQKGHGRFDKILLVGGSTRKPQVAERLKQEFAIEPEMYDPDESVAKGAAIYGWKLALDDQIKIVIAEQTGQQVDKVDLQVADAAKLREAQKQVAGKFALPAATVEKASGTKITNVTSKTFGIVSLVQVSLPSTARSISTTATSATHSSSAAGERRVEMVVNLIKRNDPVPADVTQTFGTVEDDQRTVEVRLMENLDLRETTDPASATEIGKAELKMPPRLPAGSPIQVTFRLNDQGRLEVEATEPTSKETIRIVVETACVMSDEEVEKAKSKGLAIKVS